MRLDEQLTKAAAIQSPSATFSQHIELNSSIGKIAQLILLDPTSLQGQMDTLFDELPAAIAGAIGERLLFLLKEGECREKVAASMMKIGERTIRTYAASLFPIRRIRFPFVFPPSSLSSDDNFRAMLTVVTLISASGIMADGFDELAAEMEILGRSAVGQNL